MEPYPQHSKFASASTSQHHQSTLVSTSHHSQDHTGHQSHCTSSPSSAHFRPTSSSNHQNLQSAGQSNATSQQPASKSRNSGRKKIKIEHIKDDRSRQVTFLKRKNGILKKAHELSVLCGCDVHAIVFNNDNGKLYEYFNPSAVGTLLRYANYSGPSERRCSDVTDLEGSREDVDIPNHEPGLASAATGAAKMAALRHANPENYEHAPPGVKRIHPNVGVPRVTLPSSPNPVQVPMVEDSARDSLAWRKSGIAPVDRQTVSTAENIFSGPSGNTLPKSFPEAARVSFPQLLATPQTIESSKNEFDCSTPIQTPQVERPSPLLFEQPPITQYTVRARFSNRHGLSSILHNENFSEIHCDKGPNELSGRKGVEHTGEFAQQRQSVGSACTVPSPEHGNLTVQSIVNDIKMSGENSGIETASFNNTPSSISHRPKNSPEILRVRHLQVSSTASLMSPQNGNNSVNGQRASQTTSYEPWNCSFFRQQMQHFEETQHDLPPLTPFLAELQHHAQEVTCETNPLMREAGLNALCSPHNATLFSSSTPGQLDLPSTDRIYHGDDGEFSDDRGASKRVD